MQPRAFFMKVPAALASARTWAVGHKVVATIIAVVALGGGYWVYAKTTSSAGEAVYSVGTVSKNTIVSSVTASGQVSASNQLDLTADVSGAVTSVNVKAGQKVGQGAVIARLDAGDAYRALRDAQANLESAQLSLEKLQKPATALSLTQAQNALATAQQQKQDDTDTLQQTYEDSYGDAVKVYLDMPDIMTSLQDILTGTQANRSLWNIDYYQSATALYDDKAKSYRDDAYHSYLDAKSAYDTAFATYQATPRTSGTASVEKLLDQSNTMLAAVEKATQSANSFIQFYKTTMEAHQQTVSPTAIAALSSLSGYNTTVVGHYDSISGDVNKIKTTRTALVSDDRSITEKQQSLSDVQGGADVLDVKSAQLTIEQRQNAVADAESTLAKYTIRAPFAGTIASVTAKVGQRISSGAVATIVTDRKLATLSLNEVDVSKIALGDKATLTFDAIDDLTLTGSVDEIDTVGTITQGVVSYTVKISFDSQDSRIKPGMTVNASIITESKTDVLSVPSSAVKSQNGASYVQVFDPAIDTSQGTTNISTKQTPKRVNVETGITDDTNIEIISGLTEGEQIITRTTTSATAGTAATTRTTGGAGGNRGFGGPAVRL